jgi:hypothetical protein
MKYEAGFQDRYKDILILDLELSGKITEAH